MELLTPEKAYERLIARGESFIAAFPRRKYAVGDEYLVPWDKGCTFKYTGHVNENFQYRFERNTDGAVMLITKYSDDLEDSVK